jgi:hypothetical protein
VHHCSNSQERFAPMMQRPTALKSTDRKKERIPARERRSANVAVAVQFKCRPSAVALEQTRRSRDEDRAAIRALAKMILAFGTEWPAKLSTYAGVYVRTYTRAQRYAGPGLFCPLPLRRPPPPPPSPSPRPARARARARPVPRGPPAARLYYHPRERSPLLSSRSTNSRA